MGKIMFNIALEIEIDADTPLEAAKTLKEWMEDDTNFVYVVQNSETKEIVSVDLAEDDEDAVLPYNEYEPLISK